MCLHVGRGHVVISAHVFPRWTWERCYISPCGNNRTHAPKQCAMWPNAYKHEQRTRNIKITNATPRAVPGGWLLHMSYLYNPRRQRPERQRPKCIHTLGLGGERVRRAWLVAGGQWGPQSSYDFVTPPCRDGNIEGILEINHRSRVLHKVAGDHQSSNSYHKFIIW